MNHTSSANARLWYVSMAFADQFLYDCDARLSGSAVSIRPSRVTKSDGVCGGSARIAGTRIPVWSLEASRRARISDDRILAMYPVLTREDLSEAFAYASANPVEIDEKIMASRD